MTGIYPFFQYNFIAVSCGVTANHASDRKSLIHSITSNGWKEHGVIWHCTSQCASAIDEASSLWKNSTAGREFYIVYISNCIVTSIINCEVI